MSMKGLEDHKVQGELFVFPGRVFFRGRGLHTEYHSHHASSLLLSMEDQPFRVALSEKEEPAPYRGLLLGPGVRHQLLARTIDMLVIQVVPEMYRIGPGSICEIAGPQIARIARLAAVRKCREVSRATDKILALVEGQGETIEEHPPLDARIEKSLQQIQEALPEILSVMELSIMAGLSEHRFMHLFKKEVGIPVRRYALWARMQKAAFLLQDGRSLTEAAHEAGFSDSAHMSRSFKEFFGISPSSVLGEKAAVMSWFCSELPGKKSQSAETGEHFK
ncbi:MAG: helix-turn-helix transcriptional regulator [Leptospiraceae bacterium]|nr:helix-turn-helix transcriptional regulator [Leptospiraceae bacterium]